MRKAPKSFDFAQHTIYGISGKVESGKDSLAEYILEQERRRAPEGAYQIIHYADELKRIAVEVFGLEPYQVNTHEGKKEEIHITWENLPGVISEETARLFPGPAPENLVVHEPGNMTAREFMEYLGTDVFRQIWSPCWIYKINHIIKEAEEPTTFFIPDVRSINEVQAIHNCGGFNHRLTRNPQDRKTEIETALDQENFDWNQFDAVTDNQNMSLEEKNEEGYRVYKQLTKTF